MVLYSESPAQLSQRQALSRTVGTRGIGNLESLDLFYSVLFKSKESFDSNYTSEERALRPSDGVRHISTVLQNSYSNSKYQCHTSCM